MFFKPFPLPTEPIIPDLTVSICDFGATEGEDCTKAIAAAISYAAEHDGGHVVVPKGTWHTGPIHLKSHIDLHFEDGAVLEFSTNYEDYLPVVPIVFEGIRCHNYSPMIYGDGLEHVSVTGAGVLEGNGEVWWPWKQNKAGVADLYYACNDLKPVKERVYGKPQWGLRSPFIQLLHCKHVLLDGLTLHNAPFWNIDPVWCQEMIIRNITIESPFDSPNTDGINVDACKNVLVEDCTVVSAGDDLFCLKSGRNADGREVGIPCENVIIRRCKSLKPCRSGSIVIGSEMSGGVRNILAEDCEFADNYNCIRIKSKDGRGGYVEDISYRNLHLHKGMRGINISFRYGYVSPGDDPEVPGVFMPIVRNISAENITCDEVTTGIAFENILDGCMENIHLKNITMGAEVCLAGDSVDGLYMDNVRLKQIVKK